jgi:putative FmdB family regulatory protein
MPIYEYSCHGCGNHFELLVTSGTVRVCPACGSGDLDRLVSMFAVDCESTRNANRASGRKAKAKEWEDKRHVDLDMVREHHRDDPD